MSESTAPAETAAPSLASRITRDEPAAAATDSTAESSKPEPAVGATDGATEELNGSKLDEPEYDVEIKLADLQGDPNNPLYSVKSFEELNL
jgi:ATP-dependent RNA helicase DDX19/DBP5